MTRLIVFYNYIKITLLTVWIVGGFIFWFWHLFKCRGITYCSNRTCKYRNYCFQYRERITEKEAEALLKFLDTL